MCDEYIATFDIVMLSEQRKIHLWLQYGTLPIDSFIPLGKEYITNEVLSHGMWFALKNGDIMGDIGCLRKIQVEIMNYLHHIKDTKKSLQKMRRFLNTFHV